MDLELNLPWRKGGAERGFKSVNGGRVIYDKCGCMVADTVGGFTLGTEEGRAEFIVRAANSHEALLEALREADVALSTWFSSEYCEHEIAKKVRSAIKLAEGR